MIGEQGEKSHTLSACVSRIKTMHAVSKTGGNLSGFDAVMPKPKAREKPHAGPKV
jgi:hypothetical protein